jgi:heptose-I-phosphate ethanolaminephosphotransferase
MPKSSLTSCLHLLAAYTLQHRDTKKSFDWVGLGWQYLFFWYFSGVIQLSIKLSKISATGGFYYVLLMSALWLIPTLLFPQRTRIISIAIGLILWATSLIGLGYFFIYQQELSQSVISIAFESNLAESSEYLTHYFQWWMLAGFLLYSAGAFYLWRKVRPVYLPKRRALMASLLILPSVLGKPLYKDMINP